MKISTEAGTAGIGITSILLVGIENPIALPVARSLKDIFKDLSIHALSLENGRLQSTRFSRCITSHSYIQSTSDTELLMELLEIAHNTEATVVLPVSEHFIRRISRIQTELSKHIFVPPLPKFELFDKLTHKGKLNQLLEQLDLPSAATLVSGEIDPELIDNGFFPCLLKPVYGSSGYGVMKVPDRDTLTELLAGLDQDKEYILQEYVPGYDTGCNILAIEGEIKAMTIQRCLAKKDFHFSTAIKFEHSRVIETFVHTLVQKTCFSGLANLDFRIDRRDEQPKLIDFNARCWRSISGSKTAGVDFIYLYCLAAMGIRFPVPVFNESTYLMGRSSFKLHHYYSKDTYTDIRDRLSDPLPEIIRFIN